MIHGAHVILYSMNPEADRAFLRDALDGPRVADAGGGFLIFELPPAEIAVHPGQPGKHELYLMCDDAQAFRAAMGAKGVEVSEISEQRWGRLLEVTLPSGAKLGVYEPTHASPNDGGRKGAARKAAKKPAKKKAAKKPAKRGGAKKPAKPGGAKKPARKR